MSIDFKGVLPLFHNFDYSVYGQSEKSRAYAEYLIAMLRSGQIADSTRFPSVAYLYNNNDLSYQDIRKAFKIMSDLGYLEIKIGQNAVGKLPETESAQLASRPGLIFANYHCKQLRLNLMGIHNSYQKARVYNSIRIVPALENSVSSLLIGFLIRKYNKLYDSNYLPGNFYYMHGLRLMLQAVFLAFQQKGAIIVIPENVYTAVPQILQLMHIPFVEVKMDTEGLNIDHLGEICTQYQVSALLTMTKASFPTTVYTTEQRIKELFILQQTHRFKIIEIDFFLPWMEIKENPVIKHAGQAMRDVIYIYSVNFLLKDLSDLIAVKAEAEIMTKIKRALHTIGEQAYKSIGDAAYEILTGKDFAATEDVIAKAVKAGKQLIIEIFSADGFWQMEGITTDSGLAFFLVPTFKRFPSKAYQMLRNLDLMVVNPETYGGNAGNGIRLDLSHYAAHHNFESFVRNVERKCRGICI